MLFRSQLTFALLYAPSSRSSQVRRFFEPFFESSRDILKRTVEIFEKLLKPWWNSFGNREVRSEENGEPQPREVQEREGASTSNNSLNSIGQGMGDDGPREHEGLIILATGIRLEEEVGLLDDLLENMLRYHPDEGITIGKVFQRPWFKYVGANHVSGSEYLKDRRQQAYSVGLCKTSRTGDVADIARKLYLRENFLCSKLNQYYNLDSNPYSTLRPLLSTSYMASPGQFEKAPGSRKRPFIVGFARINERCLKFGC